MPTPRFRIAGITRRSRHWPRRRVRARALVSMYAGVGKAQSEVGKAKDSGRKSLMPGPSDLADARP
jgi:hypothetical protein